ncbi:uncharacterized protein EI90DRAFT_3038800 [Cantharellus anzutake]|uniref:uncharacterized protein n=1 Tax=Cantharellus anzutake TaxID=1750568 RepID=UPI0019053E9D|nr:uncharacterized protein EI90DRAFT_3038800 [Cantharellus anzutake]KAF8340014.1 hypothetical protein EI90DRAFT_3038800 [Cantharellus anzutake]
MASRSHVEAPTIEADFLTFKALSREPLLLSTPIANSGAWVGPTSLFTVSNVAGWFAAGREQSVILSPLADLRSAFSSARTQFHPRTVLELPQKPIHTKFAFYDKVLVVALVTGQIACYDTNAILSANGATTLTPTRILSHSTEPVRCIAPNPSERPSLVAFLRGSLDSGTHVEIVDLQTMLVTLTLEGAAPHQTQSCISWSPKGKQFVVGSKNGELIQYSPEGEQKAVTPPPAARTGWRVSSVAWMENAVFHAVYAGPGVSLNDESYEAYTILREKTSITDINHPDPAPAFGDRSRETGRFFVHLRDWTPAKHFLIVADPPSTDVGIVYCKQADDPDPWATLELEETSRIVLPIDEDGNDAYPLGLDVDLTSMDPVNLSAFGGDETPPAPPSPVLYLYTNAGSLLGYHVLNKVTPSYPFLVPPSTQLAASTSITNNDSSMSTSPVMSNPSALGPSSFALAETPAFGKPAFGSTSAFGAMSAATPGALSAGPSDKPISGGFGAFSSSRGAFSPFASKQPSAFAGTIHASTTNIFDEPSSTPPSVTPTTTTNAFGAAPGLTTFGSPSAATSSTGTNLFGNMAPKSPNTAFNQPGPAASPFASASAWGTPIAPAFASAVSKPTTFGSTGFGLGGSPGMAHGASTPQTNQLTSAEGSGDDGMDTVAPASDDRPGENIHNNNTEPTAPSSVAGSSSSFVPAKGFGAFGGFGTGQSAFSKPQSLGTPTVNAFGPGALGTFTSTPTSGSPPTNVSENPMFGSTSVLGGSAKPVFGATSILGAVKPGFGTNLLPSALTAQESKPAAASSTSVGGFSAFKTASGGFSAYTNPSSSTPFADLNTAKTSAPSVFATASQQGTSRAARSVLSLRSQSMDQDDEDEKPTTSTQFDEGFLANREPETPVQPQPSVKTTNIFGAPLQTTRDVFDNKKEEFICFSLQLSESAPTSKPPSDTTPGSSSRPSSTPSPPPRLSSPSSAYPSKESSPVPQVIAETMAENTTPPGSPEKPVVHKANAEPAHSTTPAPVVQGALRSTGSPIGPTTGPIGLGRPSSVPTRFTSPFSTAPLRSSPLAASPPISRRDVTDSPSPPRPSKASREPNDEEEDGEEEEHLNELAMRSAAAKGSSIGEHTFSAPVPVSMRPVASEPISDAPKVVSRPKTPPLSAFGFGFGTRKSTTGTGTPSFPVSKSEPSTTVHSPKPSTSVSSSLIQPTPQLGAKFQLGTSSPFKATVAPSSAIPSSQAPSETGKPGINSEIDRIIRLMDNELQELQHVTQDCANAQRDITASKHSGNMRFDQRSEWSLADLKVLRRRTDDLEDDTLMLEDRGLKLKTRVAELQSLLLKAETNKQEIERFLRAREDKNFAKLLKVRELGPEHVENQTKLRQSIQLVQDRVRQLEDQVTAMKHRIERAKSGETSLKAPTLDVISRAISNIEAGALARRDQMNALSERLDAVFSDDEGDENLTEFLPPKSVRGKGSRADERGDTPLQEILARSTITPRVAAATAAALNAERSSARIKQALLSVRKEPSITTFVIPKVVESSKFNAPLSIRTASVNVAPMRKESTRLPAAAHLAESLSGTPAPVSVFSSDTFKTSPLATMVIPPGTRLPNFTSDASFVPNSTNKTPSPDYGRSSLRSSRAKQHTKSVAIRSRENPVSEHPGTSSSASNVFGLGSNETEATSIAPPKPSLSFGPLPSSGPVRNPLKFSFTGYGMNPMPDAPLVSPDTASPAPVPKPKLAFTSSPIPPIVKPANLVPRTPSPEEKNAPAVAATPPATPPSLLSRLGPPPTAQQRKEAGAQLIHRLAESDDNDDGALSEQGEESGFYEQEDEEFDEDEGDGTDGTEYDEDYEQDDGDDGEWQPDEDDESDTTENP